MFMHCSHYWAGYSVVLLINIAGCHIVKQTLEDKSGNTEQNINCNQSMEEENNKINSQQALNPNTNNAMGANIGKYVTLIFLVTLI